MRRAAAGRLLGLQESVAPGGDGRWGAGRERDEGGGEDGGVAGAAGGGVGGVYLDGQLVGEWLSEVMARQAGRPGAGTTFFDARQGPAWSSSGVA